MLRSVQRLNYHHLFYFWTIAREGTVAAAAGRLRLSRPTVTAQVRELENAFGKKLFEQVGRRLILTEFGQTALSYADDIFNLGEELRTLSERKEQSRRDRFVIGLADVMPKLIAFRLLRPVLDPPDPVHLICREGKLNELLADLALHRLDLVLSDSPASPTLQMKAYNHKLGDCGTSFFAVPQLAPKYRVNFPKSLHDAPMIFPAEQTAIRRVLNQWSHRTGIRPNILCEFEDSALLKVFGESGVGIFPAPTAIEAEVKRQYRVQLIGRLPEIRDEFYAISLERKLRHPAIAKMSDQAQRSLFVS